mgnify:FL=1
MSCSGPQPSIALAPPLLAAFKANSTGVAITSRCDGIATNVSSCLLTVCGRLELRNISVSQVEGFSKGIVCVAGSRVEVHDSEFSWNSARPLAVFDQAQLLLNASTIRNNSVKGSGGGLWAEGRASVTITGGSTVEGNNATKDGGGLFAKDHATLTVDGNSSVGTNVAGWLGGGLAAVDNASITITGGSQVLHNIARKSGGGGLAVLNSVRCVLTGGCHVHHNTARGVGGCNENVTL